MRRIVCVFLIAFLSTPALAHKLKVFAAAEGNVVSGYAYVPGGKRVINAPVRATLHDGTVIFDGRTDARGAFTFDAPTKAAYDVEVDLGDGHVGRFSVGTPVAPAPANAESTTLSQEDVERLVARHVNPLRESIEIMKDDIRFRDILTGLGFIAGIAGLWMIAAARRARRRNTN